MNGIGLQLALIAVLVLVNATFAAAEVALVTLHEGRLKRLEQQSASGEILARLARDPNRFLATIQIGITLAGFLASASAAVSLSEPLADRLEFLGGAARPVSIIGVTVVLSYVTLVLGELAPKRIAMQRAERIGLLVARPLAAIAAAARPIVWFLSASTDLVVRMLGGDPSVHREEVTAEDIGDLVAAQRSFSSQQRRIILGAVEVSGRRVDAVIVPRVEVFSLDESELCRDALARLAASGHSRAPVCVGDRLDEVVGVVHLRDLLTDPTLPTGAVASEVPTIPETAGVLVALHQLQSRRALLAVDVDSHAGAEGIVTVEDLVEELVGEIYDETDRDVLTIHHEADGSLLLPGRFPAHDLAEVGIEIPGGEYATLAGFVLSRLQRVPDEPGDVVVLDDWELTVTEVADTAIHEVRARPRSGGPRSGA